MRGIVFKTLLLSTLLPLASFGQWFIDFDDDFTSVPRGVIATGGTITNYTELGISYRAHIFTNSGTFEVTRGGSVESLIVAGGGGGGAHSGGGGGGGGLIETNLTLSANAYSVVVGLGGAGAIYPQSVSNQTGKAGLSSSFFGITIAGGGGGITRDSRTANFQNGACGGGGTSENRNAVPYGIGTLGKNGGQSVQDIVPYNGAGGGGMFGAGQSVTNGAIYAGNGGAGITNSFSGISIGYCGGGGGGTLNITVAGYPGVGSDGGGTGGRGAISDSSPGTSSTGGGGGGGGLNKNGANGGSGIVIIRYRTN